MKRVSIVSTVIVLACLINPAQAQLPGGRYAIADGGYFGCIDKEDYSRMAGYVQQGDPQAFNTAMMKGMMQGTVTSFKSGEIVYIADISHWSGLVKVRRQGDITEYWTQIKALDTINFPSQTDQPTADKNKPADRNQENLEEAVIHNRLEVVKRLLNEGTDVNAKGMFDKTALMWASNLEMAKLLLTKGADVNAKTVIGQTALMQPFIDSEVAKLLIDKGADVNAKDEYGLTPLLAACENEDSELVKLFLDKGADVHAKNDDGSTALIVAALDKEPEMVKLLLAKGAYVNAMNNYGETALFVAIKYRHHKVVKVLKAHGAKE